MEQNIWIQDGNTFIKGSAQQKHILKDYLKEFMKLKNQ